MMDVFARVGAAVRHWLADVGHATTLFVRLVLLGPACMRRFGLVRDQMHFLGNYSLAIISMALSCSPAFIKPISAVSEVPARPANNKADTTGPSSRTKLKATNKPNAEAEPKRCKVL